MTDAESGQGVHAESADAPGPESSRARQLTRHLLRPGVLAALYAVALFVSGLYLHPTILWSSAELDDYIGQARRMLTGELPYDVFHPLGYPALTAGVYLLLGDSFVAGKLVSAACTGVLLWAAFKLLREAHSGWSASLAVAVLAFHPSVFVNGLLATSEIAAAAACTVTLLCAVRLLRTGRMRDAALTGLAFGLAYWMRYPSIALAVPVGIVLAVAKPRTWQAGCRRVLVFAASVAGALVPHFLLTAAQWGRPLYDENWRNLAMRHFGSRDGSFDFNYLWENPFDSWASVIRHDPDTILANTLESLEALVTHDLPALLTGAAPVHRPVGWVEWVTYAMVLAGMGLAMRRRIPGLVLGGIFAASYCAALCLTFSVDWRAVVLCIVPLVGAATALLDRGVGLLPRWRAARVLAWLGVALAAAACLLPNTTTLWRWYSGQSPREELLAIRELAAEHGPKVRVGTTLPELDAHVAFTSYWLPRLFGTGFDGAHYVRLLQKRVAECDVDYLVFGAVTMNGADRLRALATAPLPPELAVVTSGPERLVLRVVRPTIRVTQELGDDGMLRIEVDSRVSAEQTHDISIAVVDPGGVAHVVGPLPHVQGRVVHRIDPRGLPPGEWRLRAKVRMESGVLQSSETVVRFPR